MCELLVGAEAICVSLAWAGSVNRVAVGTWRQQPWRFPYFGALRPSPYAWCAGPALAQLVSP